VKTQKKNHTKKSGNTRDNTKTLCVFPAGLRPQVAAANLVFENLKAGLGISRTNAGSQWNPVYNALHRIRSCRNEPIGRY